MERLILPASILLYMVIAIALPTLRVWHRTGVWPVVFHRDATPAARIIGALFALILLAIIIWSFLFWLVGPMALGIFEIPGWVATTCWILIAIGLLITLVAQRQMGASWRVGIDDRPTALVTHGLFAWSRNPIFASMLATMAGVALLTLSWFTLFVFPAIVLLVDIQARLEERNLLRLHGETYAAYAAHTGRFFPGVGRLTGRR